jgi:cell division topological specificity factor
MLDKIRKLFKAEANSSNVARDRLILTLQKDREGVQIPYMEDLKRELLEVVRKYADKQGGATPSQITVNTNGTNQSVDQLEITVQL